MIKTLRIEYLGAARAGRGRKASLARAHDGEGWNVVFPESVLRAYFTVDDTFDGDFLGLLYKEEDLTKAYKKLAKVWHPDLNKAHDAHDNFVKLKQAYDQLSDPIYLKRYKAGRALAKAVEVPASFTGYFRAPRNCGEVEAKVRYQHSSTNHRQNMYGLNERHETWVEEILEWRDVFDAQGRVMTASWNFEDNTHRITWQYLATFNILV